MKPINAALCSFGMSGKVFHGPFLQVLDGFNFYAVWERSKKLTQEIYPSVISYGSYEQLLADPNVELVIVNTPNYTHFDFAKKALLAGKHVVVEKPFTVTVEEGEELIALAKQQQRVLSVYQNRRFDSDYKVVKKVLKEDLLGEIVEAEFHFDRFKEELSPKVHKETAGPGTGSLYDLGSHLIDQALQLFGMPQELFADIRIIRPHSQVDDYFELLLYYPNKRVRLKSSYIVREPLPAYILHGTKGSFIKSKSDVQETALQAGEIPGSDTWGSEPEQERGFLHTERNGTVVREYIASENGNYGDYFKGIYDAIRLGSEVPVKPEQGLDVIRIIRKAFESNDQKKVVGM
ncbi:Gfo/Idh/MocA family oxidoreductase [Flavisolibacter tropicus]|uniref:Oxidoreductase n=1 Tax=Flavisolibacter tropicus TaxID=1492898 RepID=A0A172TRV8_9BACT|nr:Gfo/Idh/MocA family oxidoreductase [Flavisolibacter tropicus]ANE49718.1 oxidoreductase [Flavisolibacter tropicus]